MPLWSRITRTPTRARLVAVGIAILASSFFAVARVETVNWDPSIFVSAGRTYVPHGSPGLTARNSLGYDGQFFFRMARNPFTDATSQFGITFDHPARRQQRILYPLVVWAFSGGGHITAVLWLLVALNIAALGVIAWMGALLAEDVGRSPLYGVLFAAVPGFLISITFDTPEPLAVALALGAFVLLRRGRFAWASACFVGAALARETTLLFALGLLLCVAWGMYSRSRYEIAGRRVPLTCPLIPVLVYGVWQVILWVEWGRAAIFESGGSDLGTPLIGLIRSVSEWASRPARVRADNLLFLVAIVGFLLWALPSLRRTAAQPYERLAFVLALALALCYQPTIWYHYANFVRALSEVTTLGLIVVLGDESRPLVPVAAAAVPVWGYLAARAQLLD
jgi:hypothetical protein